MKVPPTTDTSWRKAHRIVSSRFPPVSVFDKVAEPKDLDAIYFVESLTNPRIRDDLGDISLVDPDDRLCGDGTSPIMAAFTHINLSGSRFSNGEYGVYYAANHQQTAIAETVFHVERWAKESNDPPTSFVMRVYIGRLNKRPYHDFCRLEQSYRSVFSPDPNKYAPAQKLGAHLRALNSWGILYKSVRDNTGYCVAVFRPPALGVVHQSAHLAYHWDGHSIVDVLELRSLGLPK